MALRYGSRRCVGRYGGLVQGGTAAWSAPGTSLSMLRGAVASYLHTTALTQRRDTKHTPRVPKGHWDSQENRRQFLDEVAQRCGVRETSDWAKVSVAQVREMGGSGLLVRYNSSLLALLKDSYPEEGEWEEWRPVRPKHHWSSEENCRSFMDKVAAKHNVQQPEDWKKVTLKDVREMGGGGLLQRYRSSLFLVLQAAYGPESFPSPLSARHQVTHGYWDDRGNRQAFLELVAEKYGVTDGEGWKKVGFEEIRAEGGGALLNRYSGSVYAMLADVYGDAWEKTGRESRKRVPNAYWQDDSNVRHFFDSIKEQLGVREEQDWSRVSVRQVLEAGGGSLVATSSLPQLLARAYPKVDWTSLAAGGPKKAHQRHLHHAIRTLVGQ